MIKVHKRAENERIRDFLQESFFKRFPQGRTALRLKLLKAWWKNILTAQSWFAVKSNISRPHKIMVSVLWKMVMYFTIVSRVFYFSLPSTQWQGNEFCLWKQRRPSLWFWFSRPQHYFNWFIKSRLRHSYWLVQSNYLFGDSWEIVWVCWLSLKG